MRPRTTPPGSLPSHYSVDLTENDEGWLVGVCNCGWQAPGMYPSAEDACDALMDHAYIEGVKVGIALEKESAP